MNEKFKNLKITAKGEERAFVNLRALETIWFNTGTQCNLSCQNCYIESNPKNDRLSFLTKKDLIPYFDEIREQGLMTKEIGFTGGESFLNPHIIELLELSLEKGFKTIVLTNAYRLMGRYKEELLKLSRKYGEKFLIRVSLDHYTKTVHEKERGQGTFESTLKSIKWLDKEGVCFSIAGRSLLNESRDSGVNGYVELFKKEKIGIDFKDLDKLVVFPELETDKDVPEITTSCWDILNKSPNEMMCANARMIVKRKGEDQTKVLACTLLAYDKNFELGSTLKNSRKQVSLNHSFCAQFCVLGGASCS